MENLLNAEMVAKIIVIAQGICMAVGAITLAATVIARLTPTKVDDQAMTKVSRYVLKVLHWIPTIGINPQTKKLEETIMQLREATNAGV